MDERYKSVRHASRNERSQNERSHACKQVQDRPLRRRGAASTAMAAKDLAASKVQERTGLGGSSEANDGGGHRLRRSEE